MKLSKSLFLKALTLAKYFGNFEQNSDFSFYMHGQTDGYLYIDSESLTDLSPLISVGTSRNCGEIFSDFSIKTEFTKICREIYSKP